MGWIRLFGGGKANGEADKALQGDIDRVAASVHPKVLLIPGYRKRLRHCVGVSAAHVDSLVASLGSGVDLSQAGWRNDAAVRALFARPDDLQQLLSRSEEVRKLFDQQPELAQVCVLVGATAVSKRVLGTALQGEVVQYEVPQTAVSFTDHRAPLARPTEALLREELRLRLLDYLGQQAIKRLITVRTRSEELRQQRAMLGARLRLLQSKGTAADALLSSDAPDPDALSQAEAALAENRHELEAAQSSVATLDRMMELVKDVLNHPERSLQVKPTTLRLNRMNVVVEPGSSESCDEISLLEADFADRPRRVAILGNFPRAELLPKEDWSREAQRYLG